MSVDTACSSALMAASSAVTALRSGDCSTALLAGVNVILEPDMSILFAHAGMLSPDGRCKVDIG